MNESSAFKRWASGDRSEDVWETHTLALNLMYNAMDNLLINSTQVGSFDTAAIHCCFLISLDSGTTQQAIVIAPE